jgi:hypothetical protein
VRIALIGSAVAVLLAAAPAVALAQPPPSAPPGSVTITLTPEQVAVLCAKRLPRMETRATKLTERINGGAEVRGSVAWLKDRAERERAAGRETSAQLMADRAERRAGRVGELDKIKAWVADFRSRHCGAT